MKSQALLNESVGAGYIERNWPPALKESGAWPLASLRQSFLNGSLTRLLDPDTTLRNKIVEFVSRGDFGLASGQKPDGSYEHILFKEFIDPADVTFESGVFLILKAKAIALRAGLTGGVDESEKGALGFKAEIGGKTPEPGIVPEQEEKTELAPEKTIASQRFRISGFIPTEIWNRLGTKIIPKLRSGSDINIGIQFEVSVDAQSAKSFEADLRQILEDLKMTDKISIEKLMGGNPLK
jgi:hypothetical protein